MLADKTVGNLLHHFSEVVQEKKRRDLDSDGNEIMCVSTTQIYATSFF